MYKYQLFFLVLSCLSLTSFSCSVSKDRIKNKKELDSNNYIQTMQFPSEEVKKLLGDSIVNIIINTDSIQVFLIGKQRGDSFRINDYEIINSKKIDNNKLRRKVKELLLSSSSYLINDFQKSCLFFPQVVIRFFDRKEDVFMDKFIDLRCKEMLLKFKTESKMVHIDLIDNQLLHLLFNLFPDDFELINQLNE